MVKFICLRTLSAIPVAVLVSLFVFSLLYLAPGDPAIIIAGELASNEDIARIRTELGLDRSFFHQFVAWLQKMLSLNLGESIITRLSVATLIQQRLEPTLSLMVLSMLVSVLIAVPLGGYAAKNMGKKLDKVLVLFTVLGFSVPVFVVGYGLSYLFSVNLHWFPVQGYSPISDGVSSWLKSLALPVLAISCANIALIARVARASMLDVLQEDYIRTAQAKGITIRKVLFVHAMKNAAAPIVTVVGISIATLIGGAVITESVFSIPGLGRLTIDSILKRDYPVIQALILMFSLVYILMNTITDILYRFLDPRIEY